MSCTWWRPRTSGATSPARSAGATSTVTSLITNPNADPHLFETDAADAATLAQAQVVDRERRRLRHLDGLTPRCRRRKSADRQRRLRAPRHGERPQPPPLVRHPPRAHGGRRHRRRAGQGRTPGRVRPSSGNLATLRRVARPPQCHTGHHQGATSTTCPWRTPSGSRATRWPWRTSTSRRRRASPGRSRTASTPVPADTLAMQQLITDHDINVLLYNVQTVTPVTTQIRALARSTASPSSASPRPCRPASPPTSSGSSRS